MPVQTNAVSRLVSHAFAVTIDGKPIAITSISDIYAHEIRLTKPLIPGDTLFVDWSQEYSRHGTETARDIQINLIRQDQPMIGYTLGGAKPVKYSVSDLDATSRDLLMETLTVHTKFLPARAELTAAAAAGRGSDTVV